MDELYINSNWIEVEGVKLKRQISDFGQLDAKTNISNKFKINWTKENAEIFEWFKSIQSNSLLPYIETPVKLRRNKNYLIESGYAVITKSNDNSFNIIVRDGNIDFFKEIEGKSIRDLDFSDLDYTWNIDYAKDNRTATDKPVYLFHSFGLGYLDIAHSLPFIPINVIVDKIFSEAGYSKSGDVFTDANYTDLFISMVDRLPNESDTGMLAKAEITNQVQYTAGDGSGVYLPVLFDTYSTTVYLFTKTAPSIGTVTAYRCKVSGDYSLKLQVKYKAFRESGLPDYIWIYNGSAFRRTLSNGVNTYEETINNITRVAGDYIYIYLERQPGNTLYIYDGSLITEDNGYLEITAIPTAPYGVYGTEYEVSNNLPQMMQKDLLHMIAILFNTRLEKKNSTIYFYKYSELKTKIQEGDYTDWSDKKFSNIKINYQSKYAKKNVIKYSNTEIFQGYFEIDDIQLSDFKTLYTLPVINEDSSKSYKKTVDQESNVSFEFSNMRMPVIKKRVLEDGTVRLWDGDVTYEPVTNNLPTVENIDLQDYIDDYYSFMEETLNMYREITADVYLNINDFNKIDFELPVWIKNWGWFMLEPLIFREGLSTVTLIHINKSSYVPDIAGDGDYNSLDYNLTDYY